MAKRLSAKVGEFKDKQTGDTKGEYVQIGVLLQGNNGEYLLLDPTVCLSGILARQNVLEHKKGGIMRDNVMCGIYEEQNNQQQGGFNQQQSQNQNQGQQQQGGYGQQQNNNYQNQSR